MNITYKFYLASQIFFTMMKINLEIHGILNPVIFPKVRVASVKQVCDSLMISMTSSEIKRGFV